jgi:hypothetical protein
MRFLSALVILLFNLPFAFAQKVDLPGLKAVKINYEITLDGFLDEPVWKGEEWAKDFKQFFPADTSLSITQSKVKVAYNDKFIYLAAVMYNPAPRSKYVSTSLRRDFRGEQNDGISFVFDTFNDNTNAFQFGVNPYGVQREALLANGGTNSSDLNLAWDNKWYSTAKIFEDHWVVEVAIPFSSLRFKEGADNWNVNFYRIDSKYNERSTWAPIPRNFNVIALAFTRKLYFEEPLKKSGSNISIIPYAAMGGSKNNLTGASEAPKPSFGGDVKVGVGPAMNLDLTVNPDFSQVEVDEQVTNLDRFEIFFPERRQFFLENGDLFADFGAEGIRPFFSRRIGVARDENTGQNVQNRILYGARLSGKLNDNWRLGVMNMQTAAEADRGITGKNFSVAAVQKKVFSRSNIGMIMVNRESMANEEGLGLDPRAFNRLVGIDYNLASKDNKWAGKFFYHQSFENERKGDEGTAHAQLNYTGTNLAASFSYSNVGDNYNPLVGFTPRTGYERINPQISYRFFPKSKLINRHGPGIESEVIRNGLGVTDELHTAFYSIQFQSLSTVAFSVNNRYTYLFFPFDPTRTGGEQLEQGTDYRNTFFGMRYMSNPRKVFFVAGRVNIGEYFTGTLRSFNGSMNYRMGYLANISMNFSYNNIRLPAPQNSADLYLVGPRIDLTVNRNLFWTTFVQYNSQIDNINLNTRLQWRFAPVSDFFLVYTDNYIPESMMSKQRAFVMKLNYWFNI